MEQGPKISKRLLCYRLIYQAGGSVEEPKNDQAGGEDETDHTRGYYISEQTSHHPPKSSYFYMAPEHGIRIDGVLKPRSKFLGNSAASMMEGIAVLRFMDTGGSKGEER
ncbi:MAG: hypothetical protein Q9167_000196 [Letrouitia subvulpina]